MAKPLVSNLFAQLIAECKPGGRVNVTNLAAFLANPNRWLPTGGIAVDQKLIGLVPKGHALFDLFGVQDDKPLYTATRGDGQMCVVFGKEKGRTYQDNIAKVTIAQGKPLYIIGDLNEAVVWGDVEGEHYSSITDLTFAEGKPLYRAKNRGVANVIVWGEEETVLERDVNHLSCANGKLLYASCALTEADECVVFDGKESRSYLCIHYLTVADGKPLYVAENRSGPCVVWGDAEYSSYDNVLKPVVAEGKLLYTATVDSKDFVVWGDIEGELFDSVTSLTFAEGKPLYRANRAGLWRAVWGDVTSQWYKNVEYLSVDEGKLLFVAEKDDEMFVVWEDSKSKERIISDNPRSPMVVDGQVCFLADTGNGDMVVWGDYESQLYDCISDFRQEGDRIVFAAYKGRRIFQVTLSHC
ncbi:MAG: hypothetical protein WC766_01785 [Patescibacteria group bacterium]|jgi:hypothetical protein